jgi:hypothetical protein
MRKTMLADGPIDAAAQNDTHLAAQIHAEHQAAGTPSMQWIEHARRAGELLIAAKARLPHGQWGLWLKKHVRFGFRTSARYMRLARRWHSHTPAP